MFITNAIHTIFGVAAFCAFIVGSTGICTAQESLNGPKWQGDADGFTIIAPLRSAPYPHPSRSAGHTYDGKVYSTKDHYSNSDVAIFVPTGFKPSATTDFIVHFHGWNNHVSEVLKRYRLRDQMHAARVNAILVVPQGPYDAPDSGGGKLELDAGGFAMMMKDVIHVLKSSDTGIKSDRIGKIVLSTHSGGYATTAGVLEHGGLTDHITDLLLFDSTYGGLDKFASWAAGSRRRRLISLFTQHLAPENFILQVELKRRGIKAETELQEAITTEMVQPRGVHMYHIQSIEHDEILQKQSYFELFLRGSALSKM